MKKFAEPDSDIHLIARAFLTQGDDIILCKTRGGNWFFLPGGHVENGESARSALSRELIEETGREDFLISSFIGVCENVFSLGEDQLQHEVNIIFEVKVPEGSELTSLEKHIEFIRVTRESFNDSKILPESLKTGLVQWLKGREPFMGEL